jgi:hypothetical protein
MSYAYRQRWYGAQWHGAQIEVYESWDGKCLGKYQSADQAMSAIRAQQRDRDGNDDPMGFELTVQFKPHGGTLRPSTL